MCNKMRHNPISPIAKSNFSIIIKRKKGKRERARFACPLNTLSLSVVLTKAYAQVYDKIIFSILQAKF